MAKVPRYLYVLGVATVGLVAYTFLSAPEVPVRRAANNRFIGGSSSGTKTADTLLRPEDYTASFPPVNVVPRDAFKPLVAKTTVTLKGQATPLGQNGIPSAFAGGDGNWIYTGNAVVDGVPNALLENTTTQEGVFLRPGERWKSLTLASVTANRIQVIGPGGKIHSVSIADDSATVEAAPIATASGALPAVTPNAPTALSGPIGGVGTANAAPATDGRTNRGGRRNRRNNRNNSSNGAQAPVGSVGATSGNP